MGKWNFEKENLMKLILEDKISYEEIGRMYGCSGSNIRKVAKNLGITLESRRKINPEETFNKGVKRVVKYCLNCGKELEGSLKKYCSNVCQQEHRYKEYILAWKNGEESGTTKRNEYSEFLRRYLFDKYNNKCQKCGWKEINPYTGKIPLQIHHIDGDCTNNTEENLQLLCPNCHSLTENFGSLNSNSKRYSYLRESLKNKD